MTDGYAVQLASTEEQVQQIKQLQMENLRRLLPAAVQETEGFVTAEYTVEYLLELHAATPAVVALDAAGAVVGYVLACTRAAAAAHRLMGPLAVQADAAVAADDATRNADKSKHSALDYILVAQLCVARRARGRALAQRMYQCFAREYTRRGFARAVTDVARDNFVSLAVHKKSGWRVIDSITHDNVAFDIVVLDFDTN